MLELGCWVELFMIVRERENVEGRRGYSSQPEIKSWETFNSDKGDPRDPVA